MNALCPVCGQTVAAHDGRLVRHHGQQMRWSGRQWFRTTCRGSGRAVAQKVIINVVEPPPPRPVHPCEIGHHRWAWLTDGGEACGYCGVKRA